MTRFERAMARWRMGGLGRRRPPADVSFREPGQPAASSSDVDGGVEAAGDTTGRVDTRSGSLARVTGGPISTVEAADRAYTAEMFGEVNAYVEAFVRSYRRSAGLDQRGENVATVMATVADCLFGPDVDIAGRVRSRLVITPEACGEAFDAVIARAHVLRSRIRQARDLEVEDTAPVGVLLVPERQEPWKSSTPHAPVRFMVFPGLSSRGRVLVKQQVYTMGLREARSAGLVE
ncbi:hypothetical protein [Amycolatopsis sp. NPDC004378]